MKREVLLEEAARRLGHQRLTREVRKPLNEAILAERRAGRVRAERGRVWLPKERERERSEREDTRDTTGGART